MKYYKQRGKKDCVPIALLNAYIFVGYKPPYHSFLNTIKNKLGYDRTIGTMTKQFKELMKSKTYFAFKSTYKANLTFKYIRKVLAQGKAIMYIADGHISLIIADDGKKLTFVNLDRQAIKSKLSYERVKEQLSAWHSFGYVIERKS